MKSSAAACLSVMTALCFAAGPALAQSAGAEAPYLAVGMNKEVPPKKKLHTRKKLAPGRAVRRRAQLRRKTAPGKTRKRGPALTPSGVHPPAGASKALSNAVKKTKPLAKEDRADDLDTGGDPIRGMGPGRFAAPNGRVQREGFPGQGWHGDNPNRGGNGNGRGNGNGNGGGHNGGGNGGPGGHNGGGNGGPGGHNGGGNGGPGAHHGGGNAGLGGHMPHHLLIMTQNDPALAEQIQSMRESGLSWHQIQKSFEPAHGPRGPHGAAPKAGKAAGGGAGPAGGIRGIGAAGGIGGAGGGGHGAGAGMPGAKAPPMPHIKAPKPIQPKKGK